MDKNISELVISKERLIKIINELTEKGYNDELVIELFKTTIDIQLKECRRLITTDLEGMVTDLPLSNSSTVKVASILEIHKFMAAAMNNIIIVSEKLKNIFAEAGIFKDGDFHFDKIKGFDDFVKDEAYPNMVQLCYQKGDDFVYYYITKDELKEVLEEIGLNEESYSISLDGDYYSLECGLLINREKAIRDLGGNTK